MLVRLLDMQHIGMYYKLRGFSDGGESSILDSSSPCSSSSLSSRFLIVVFFAFVFFLIIIVTTISTKPGVSSSSSSSSPGSGSSGETYSALRMRVCLSISLEFTLTMPSKISKLESCFYLRQRAITLATNVDKGGVGGGEDKSREFSSVPVARDNMRHESFVV